MRSQKQIFQYAKPKRIDMRMERYEDGTPWMDLFENVSVYKLWPEAFIQNSRTKRAGTTYHFLTLEPGHVTSFLWQV